MALAEKLATRIEGPFLSFEQGLLLQLVFPCQFSEQLTHGMSVIGSLRRFTAHQNFAGLNATAGANDHPFTMAVLTSFPGTKPANISHRPKPHEVTRCLRAFGLFNSFRYKSQQHVVTLDAHRVGFCLHAALSDAGTADHVKLPAMQRTGYDASFQTTLAQRPATMQTTVVDCMQSPGDIEYRNLLALHFHNFGGLGRNVADSTRLYELIHALLCLAACGCGTKW